MRPVTSNTYRAVLLAVYGSVLLLLLLLAGIETFLYDSRQEIRMGASASIVGMLLLLTLMESSGHISDSRRRWGGFGLRILLVELFHAIYHDPVITTFLYLTLVLTAYHHWGGRTIPWALAAVFIQFVPRQLLLLAHVHDRDSIADGLVFSLVIGVIGLLIGLLLRLVDDERHQRTKAESLLHQLQVTQGQLIELSMTEERNRLARDIHDSLGHALTSIHLQLEKALAYQTLDADTCTVAIRNAQNAAQHALYEVRESVTALRQMQRVPLHERLSPLKTEANHAGLQVDIRIQGDDSACSPYLINTLYRCVQEGLTNVRRHAQASRVQVQVCFAEPAVSLDLCDDGKGFNAEQIRMGYGLRGIEERVHLLRGSYRLQSTIGEGTCLSIQIPYSNAD